MVDDGLDPDLEVVWQVRQKNSVDGDGEEYLKGVTNPGVYQSCVSDSAKELEWII